MSQSICVLAVFVCLSVSAAAQQPKPSAATAETTREFTPPRLAMPPVIDGALDDEAWAGAPLELGEWLSYNPLYGDKLPHRTDVWGAYDADYLYFAFRCTDPEPQKIKTAVRRRDTAFQDDWVGFALDSLGTRQTSYDHFINPSGMQMDILNSAASGEELAPDWVWESAARQTDTGYTVEVRIPFQSIRFKGGSQVRMGIRFWRRISRLGVSVSWPDMPPGRTMFEGQATLVYADLEERRTRELMPTSTFSMRQARETPSRFGDPDNDGDVGVSVKYGITSSVTLDATVNPDFSQVESDAFQVEINQRFPVFYSEKRPFFMEGSGLFSLAGPGGDVSLVSAVHTRRIEDPSFGVKLTGSAGRVTFGTLTALDQAPGRGTRETNPYFGREKLFNVARAQYSMGPGNYIGALLTDTEFASGHNRAAGADFAMKLSASQRLTGMALYTMTRTPDGKTRRQGGAGHASYWYNTKQWTFAATGEHYERDFEMDTAFYNRTGHTGGWIYTDYNFYPDKKKYPAIRRIVPRFFGTATRDRVQRGDEWLALTGIRMHFTRQGFLLVDQFFGEEVFAGRSFKIDRLRGIGNVQILRWLFVNSNFMTGYAPFYDPVNPLQGRTWNARLGVTLQPTGAISQDISFNYVTFDREDTGANLYTVRILNTRTTYQFTKYLAARAIVQYDSQRRRVLTDVLGSYEFRPGTVFYAGYGSLIEQRLYDEDRWITGRGDYITTTRGLFLKASYLYRF
jgi:hypothetical protein